MGALEDWYRRTSEDIQAARDATEQKARAIYYQTTRQLAHVLPQWEDVGHAVDEFKAEVKRQIGVRPAPSIAPPPRQSQGARMAPPPRTAPATARDDTGYYQLGLEWLTGRGPREHHFGQDDPATQVLRRHDHIQEVRQQISSRPPQIGVPQKAPYSLGGLGGVSEFAKDYAAVPTGGAAGNLAAAYLGSYPLQYEVTGVDNQGLATVRFNVENNSTAASAMHPPLVGYAEPYQRYVDPVLNELFLHGPASKTRQTFTWSEKIPLQRNKAHR